MHVTAEAKRMEERQKTKDKRQKTKVEEHSDEIPPWRGKYRDKQLTFVCVSWRDFLIVMILVYNLE
jgi:hypothetical protein